MIEDKVINFLSKLDSLTFLKYTDLPPGNHLVVNESVKDLIDSLSNYRRLMILVTDNTRPTPTKELLNSIIPNLNGLEVEVVIATGLHSMTLSEAINMVGNINIPIHVHNADKDVHEYIGTTPQGIPVELLRSVIDSDAILIISYIMPHPWSGFSGGAKLLLPGISSRESIIRHHVRFYNHPMALPGVIEGNPFRSEIDYVLKLLPNDIYGINVVDVRGGVIYGTIGELSISYAKAVDACSDLRIRDVAGKFDTLVIDARPLNINLYQSMKALFNNLMISHRNSLIVLLTSCRGGGPREFVDYLLNYDKMSLPEGGDVVPYLVASCIRERLKDKELIIVTDGLDEVKADNIEITRNVDDVVKLITNRIKLGDSVGLIYEGSKYVHRVKGGLY